MKLIVGLGNIGRQYKDTPHNVGFEYINTLRRIFEFQGYSVDAWKNEKMFLSEICKVRKGNDIEYVLAKPTTYMNLSGSSVGKLVDKFSPSEVIIIHDDLDLKVGEYKIQKGKGPKSHNGVNSLSNVSGSDDFIRVRVGVESREDKRSMPGEIYVIRKMDSDSILTINECIEESIKQLLDTIS